MQQTTQSKSNKNKAALDEEIEAQMKQLQSNMYSLKGHVDVGNVEVAQQEGNQKNSQFLKFSIRSAQKSRKELDKNRE